MRGDLCQLLYDAAKDGTKYIVGTSVDQIKPVDDGLLDVLFSNGNRD